MAESFHRSSKKRRHEYELPPEDESGSESEGEQEQLIAKLTARLAEFEKQFKTLNESVKTLSDDHDKLDERVTSLSQKGDRTAQALKDVAEKVEQQTHRRHDDSEEDEDEERKDQARHNPHDLLPENLPQILNVLKEAAEKAMKDGGQISTSDSHRYMMQLILLYKNVKT